MSKARLARFYGWTDREIEIMDYGDCQDYLLCIEPLQAEETLVSIQSAIFPNMKIGKQKSVEKDLRRRIDRHSKKSSAPDSTEDLYHSLLRTLGNG